MGGFLGGKREKTNSNVIYGRVERCTSPTFCEIAMKPVAWNHFYFHLPSQKHPYKRNANAAPWAGKNAGPFTNSFNTRLLPANVRRRKKYIPTISTHPVPP